MGGMSVRRSHFALATFATAVLTVAATACTRPTVAETPAPAHGSPALVVEPAPLLPTTTDALPPIGAEGFRELLAQLEGTPVVVNLWASWCGPCERELPMLTRAARRHPDVQFVGVNVQDSREGAEGFVREYSIPYPSVFDPAGDILTELDAIGPPVTAFYASNGAEVAKVVGEIGAEDLDRNLAAISP